MTVKPVTARVAALRERRSALGLTRLELYVHPDDRSALKALAKNLTQKRQQKTHGPVQDR